MSDPVNPAASFGQWFNVGQGLGGAVQAPGRMDAYKQQQEALAAQQRAMDEARARALAPGATAKDRQGWVMLYAPEQAKQLTEAFAGMDKASADEMNLGSGEVVSMVRAGNIDLAKDALERRAILAESSGDEQSAKFARSMAQTLDVDPKVVENYFLDMMSFSPGGDKVIETLNKKGEEGRNVELHPGALLKQAADLDYTRAQTAKLAHEMKLASEGKLPPEKVFEQEEKLRKELNGRSALYQELGNTYSTLSASANSKTPAGDIALITSFMKMLDPGSVVRETEFAKAQDTAGLTTKLQAMLQKQFTGNIFPNTPEGDRQRKEYVDLAREYFKSAEKKKEKDVSFYRGIAQGYGLDFSKIDPEYSFSTGEKQSPASDPDPKVIDVKPSTGQSGTSPAPSKPAVRRVK